MSAKKIILIGYMGAGKTTVGTTLSKQLKMPFIDLDEYISRREDMTITNLFEQRGELYFRKVEREYLENLLSLKQSMVLACGGGTPCYGENMKQMIGNRQSVCIYLKASVDILCKRLCARKAQRPLIANLENSNCSDYISKHLFERNFYYSQAQISVSIGEKKPIDIAREIYDLLKEGFE